MSGYSKYLRGRGVGIKYLRKEGKRGVLVSGVWWGKQRVEVGSRREGRRVRWSVRVEGGGGHLSLSRRASSPKDAMKRRVSISKVSWPSKASYGDIETLRHNRTNVSAEQVHFLAET